MNSTDMPPLLTALTAPPVSRAEFFAQLLAEPTAPGETPSDDFLSSNAPEPAASSAALLQPPAAGFPA